MTLENHQNSFNNIDHTVIDHVKVDMIGLYKMHIDYRVNYGSEHIGSSSAYDK